MSRNQREGFYAGKYGSAKVLRRGGFKGRRIGSARHYREEKECSLRSTAAAQSATDKSED